ncbi:MAG: DUF4405 domain-containing protein [Aliarcobacter sp.]|nr:DUF4405 domain-containing protein [Aliarcobacter sp.]
MSLKKTTSLTMLLTMFAMTFTGIILFITPPGRVANWANWELFGISKELYAQLHSTFMVLFVITTIIHIYYNWKPLISYMKNELKQFVLFTKEMIISTILFVIFIFGTVYELSPFSNFINFGDDIKSSWEKEYGTAPYSHAELSSLISFTKKMSYDLETSKNVLTSNNITFQEEQSLSQIAKINGVSPKFVYDLLRKNLEKGEQKSIPLTGLGKKSIKDVAMTLEISSDEFISKLKELGLDAKENDKFKDIAESKDLSPYDILEKLGYKKVE